MTTTKNPGLGARTGSVEAALAARQSTVGPSNGHTSETAAPVATSLRLPADVHKALRKIAYEDDVSIHSLLMEGVEMVIAKRGK